MSPSSPSLSPAQVVDGQLRAYNAKDIDAFMAFWADDARLYQHPDTLLASGAAEIRARHVLRFQEPNLHGRLLHRVAVGATVVDHEVVTRTFPEGPGTVEVIGIYEVVAGRISRAWFTLGTPLLGEAAPLGQRKPRLSSRETRRPTCARHPLWHQELRHDEKGPRLAGPARYRLCLP